AVDPSVRAACIPWSGSSRRRGDGPRTRSQPRDVPAVGGPVVARGRVLGPQPLDHRGPPEERARARALEPVLALPPGAVVDLLTHGARGVAQLPGELGRR